MNKKRLSSKGTLGSGFFAIMQKELKRFFTDRRMVITTVLLPGLFIYLVYSFIGGAVSQNLSVGEDYVPKVYAVNLPASLQEATAAAGLDFEEITPEDITAVKEQIAAKESDLLAVFPEDFDESIQRIIEGESSVEAATTTQTPEVSLFFNSTRIESGSAYSLMQTVLESYREAIKPVFSVNSGDEVFNLATEQDTAGFMFAAMLPMLLMIFLYSGAMAVAPESIAGEKERGTIATLLVTPIKRWELALGKVVSLCIISLLAGASSFIGVMLSLPKMFQNQSSGGAGEGAFSALGSASIYSVQEYLMLLAVILSTVVLFVGIISILSAFARTIKEANTMATPLMIIVMLVGASAMFQASSATDLQFYLIPIYNSVQSMIAIFSFTANPAAIALTIGVNFALAGVFVLILTRMFESERVIFNK